MYLLRKFEKGFTVKFSATFEGIDSICLDLKRFMSDNGFGELCFDIILGVREALSNAVRHGSKMDPEKEVLFSIETDARRVLIRVTDSGSGFDWQRMNKKVPLTTETEGRGHGILDQYFDSCYYNERGNEVELIKKIKNGDCS